MAPLTHVHVVPGEEGGWDVLLGRSRWSHHRKQEEAIDSATELARKERAELFIHGNDGRIRERNSYGNDPHPPPG